MSLPKPRLARIDLSLAVPIVGDAAIADRAVADGRMLPVLILDTTGREEIAELIRVHTHLPPGDAVSQWGSKLNNDDDTVILALQFLRPVELDLPLVFSIEKQAMLVEAMLTGGGVCLQAGGSGDRLGSTMDADRMMVELPDSDFRPYWDKLLMERMVTVMARRLGVRRRKARPVAEAFIAEMRKFTAFRMPP